MRAAASITQVVQSPPPDVPIADTNLATHRHVILYSHLPGIDAYIQQDSQIRPCNYFGRWEVVTNQRQAQDEECDRLEAAKVPKSPSGYWNETTVHHLSILCGVNNEMDLPKVWHNLANAGSKRD
ncbi:hypothetical protein ACA910_008948 [Epithemia clementina (nom. ined.)]